jgi:hypothetical protein
VGSASLMRGVRRTEELMRKRVVAATCAGLTFCFVVRSAAQDISTRDELEQLKESLAETIADNMTSAEVYDTNGFRVESAEVEELGASLKPNGTRFQMLSVTADGVFRVGIEKGRPMSTGGGVGIFHRETGTPMVSIGDRNGDGLVDILTYAVLDENGQVVLDVVDYEADGQPDMRINFRDHYFEIWHIERWYRTEVREGRRGIVIDGEFVELQRGENRWIVP